jgi:hypothetical protein
VELFLERMPLHDAESVEESGAGGDTVLATLRVRRGLSGISELPVRGAQSVLGSDPASDLAIAAPGVAARHGQLRLRGGVWTYIDFGSTDGSQVDGEPVRGEALLAPGSAIRVGEVELAFDPSDRWEDSPPERRASERHPMVMFPPEARTRWPLVLVGLAVIALGITAFFLLRGS